jgi:arylsulfatase A-like enzyme
MLVFPLAAFGAEGRKPNVLMVVADQWRAQAFGFAGDPNVRTPNLDRFAAKSVRFVNAVSGMPVCSPMRASLLTGQRPLTHGIFLNDVPLNPDALTFPEVLRQGGYQTGAIGKWHVDGHGRSSFIPRERRQGFEFWKVLECTHNYTNSVYFGDAPKRERWEGYDAFAQARAAGDFIRQQAKDTKPFLLYLSWGPPHDPYFSAPENYRALYNADTLKLRPNIPAEMEKEARGILAGYYAHCTALDDAMGELLRALEESGEARETIVIFTADHGDMLGSQGMYKKQKPFDESIRVPMLVRWPAGLGEKGVTLDAPINSEDVMPTLLGLCGFEIPESAEGIDYSGYMKGGKNPSDGATVIQCVAPFGEWERRKGGREYRGVRTTRYTYVRDLKGPWLLFDNQEDSYQTNNLIDVGAHSALQAEMEALLRRKLAERRDEFRPAAEYIAQWGYEVDANGTVPIRQ